MSSSAQQEDKALREVLKKQGPPPFFINFFLGIVKLWLFVYDILNYVPYAIFNSPAEKLKRSQKLKARPLVKGDTSSPWRNVDNDGAGRLLDRVFPHCDTVDKTWNAMVAKFGPAPALGTREVVKVYQEQQPNGRFFEKVELGEYFWESYEDVDFRVNVVASGLLDINHRRSENLVIYSETRAEWLITALACFKNGFTVVTVYSTLGEEAIAHAINETQATTIVTTAELIPKVQSIVSQCKSLKRAIYFQHTDPDAEDPDLQSLNDLCDHVLAFDELETMGEDRTEKKGADPDTNILPSDLACIMYTSGTTGPPKGVMITHGNLVAAVSGQAAGVTLLTDKDIYIGFLPLAHILELDAELTCLSQGTCIGYSSPLTLHDRASKIKRGTHGDCYALRPTLMAAVPAIMDRIFKAVSDEVAGSSRLMQELFRLNYERKRARLEDGYDSPFLNRIVFRRIRGLLGGQLRGVLCGGAPLNPETQRFMNICFCCPVIQGYGLTETCGAGSIADVDDLTTGVVGPPVRCSDIMLREWPEAGYSPTNDPPQGEILISGPNVTLGYYKNDEKTNEEFITLKGKRWFATGDIGQFREDGSLKIIDRKKDLVKLSHGEYVSLARVETALLTSSLVDNICVYGNSMHSYLIALVVPTRKKVEQIAEKLGVGTFDWERLCQNKDVTNAVLKELTDHATKAKLNKTEYPGKIYLCPETWTPDSGLLTEALKLKRRPIADAYKKVIEQMYSGD